jgi:hypothetical protein
MNRHFQQQICELLERYSSATLATAGPAGLQIGLVPYQLQHTQLYLLLAHGSDQLFNLEQQPDLVLLTEGWKLAGRGSILPDSAGIPAQPWQTVVRVEPLRLHLLREDGQSSCETIDF